MDMPAVDMTQLVVTLTAPERTLVTRIVRPSAVDNYSGREQLRASKPKVDRRDPESGKAAYVWRMVVFMVSPRPRHHCMPVCAEFDLPERDYDRRRELVKELDALVDKIVDAVDPREWHGAIRWGQAYGLIGTPRYNDEGAVIYR